MSKLTLHLSELSFCRMLVPYCKDIDANRDSDQMVVLCKREINHLLNLLAK